MCGRNCCGAFWNICLVIFLVASVACPWYAFMGTAEIDQKKAGNWTAWSSCSVVKLRGWRTETCILTDDCAKLVPGNVTRDYLKDFICNKGDSYPWRSDDNKHMSNIFDVGYGLAVMSLLCAVISCLGFFIRCCCRDNGGKNTLLTVVSVLGFLFAAVSIGYFAAALPGAFTDDKQCKNDLPTDDGVGPCYKFFGKQDSVLVLPSIPIIGDYQAALHLYWGPIGWALSVVAMPAYLIVLCLSCTRAGGYTSINDSGKGPAYHRHDAAGANYV